MKTAVSLPDDLFREAEELARRLGKSRSDLYRTAIEDYLARHDADRIREALNRALRDVDHATDFVRATAGAILEKSEW